jgi:dihydroorotate dehydrogenase (NAD+) catalytic subunit
VTAGEQLPAAIELCGVRLRGPVLNGSGTFDAIAARRTFGDALLEEFPFDAFVSKTITIEPRQGNPPPRLFETPAGLLNSIGLPNKGLEGFLAEDLPQLAELPVPLIVSVMGFSRDELAMLVERVGEREEIAMVELNVSCPNVETGLVMGAEPAETAAALARVRPLTGKPLIVKLTPNAVDPAAVGAAAEAAGADALSLVNTLKGMAIDPQTRAPWLGGVTGGLSGPAVRAVALEQVRAVARAVRIPLIGMGGIASGRDAADFIGAGADCVAVGTESFRDPSAGRRIARELAADFPGERGFSSDRRGRLAPGNARSEAGKCGKTPANGPKTVKYPEAR